MSRRSRPSRSSRFITRVVRSGLASACVGVAIACGAPRVKPLVGVTPTNAILPRFDIPAGHWQMAFDWDLSGMPMVLRGHGVARLASPDSVRVDLEVAGGFGGLSAMLFGDSVSFPPNATMTDLMPPPPLLWAALGRLALPALPDTVIRVLSDTLRAEIGTPAQWRITAVRDTLTGVERLENGRIVESVTRIPGRPVRYQSADHRTLVLNITQVESVDAFSAAIWTYGTGQ